MACLPTTRRASRASARSRASTSSPNTLASRGESAPEGRLRRDPGGRRRGHSPPHPSRGDTALDVACGPGNFSREFAHAVGEEGLVIGIDASRTMLARGVADLEAVALGNLALIRGDATRLPIRDASFDGVCCFAALHLFA